MSIEWTPDLRAAWDKSWSEHHMQIGLMLMREKLWPTTVTIPAGHDAQIVSASAHNALVGNNQVFRLIEELRKDHKTAVKLPPPNTPEALGKTVTRPE
jgi:hypothetical protein